MSSSSAAASGAGGTAKDKILSSSSIDKLPTIENKTPQTSPFKLKRPVFQRNICGDKFGTSPESQQGAMLGMLYQSRCQVGILDDPFIHIHSQEASKKVIEDKKASEEIPEDEVDVKLEDETEDDEELSVNLNPKQRLSVTIKNWSVLPENDEHLMNEGAVSALISLCSIDDRKIKRSCAGALYHLSTRETNRDRLLEMGAAAGLLSIVTGGGGKLTWEVAKHSALAFCNLSMQSGGEARMSKEGSAVALVSLFGVRSNVLLPMCCQSLYNLTCVPGSEEYVGLERIAKVLLTLPSTPKFDFVTVILKSMVNCTRFESVRPRVIEDGILNTFQASLLNISYRENRGEVVHHMAACLRALAASRSCRLDMISKGSIDLLNQLMPHCNESALLFCVRALYDLLSYVNSFPSAIFDNAVNAAIDVFSLSDNPDFSSKGVETMWQYVASIICTCTKHEYCKKKTLVDSICRCMPKILQSKDRLTNFFSIISAGNIFFNNLCYQCDNPVDKIKTLLVQFFNTEFVVDDQNAKQGLSLALAMLSCDDRYLNILMQENLGVKVLKLAITIAIDTEKSLDTLQSQVPTKITSLRSRSPTAESIESSCDTVNNSEHDDEIPESSDKQVNNIQADLLRLVKVLEYAAISLCRIVLKLDSESLESELRLEVASYLIRNLSSPVDNVIETSLTAIRALLYEGICFNEFLGEELINQTAELAIKNIDNLSISRPACAILAVMSYSPMSHEFLSQSNIITILFDMVSTEDVNSRELIAACFCNMSIKEEIRNVLIDAGVLVQLKKLSNIVNEIIQSLCARCMCNLTCSIDRHERMLLPLILEDESPQLASAPSPSSKKGANNKNEDSSQDYGILSVVDMICQVRTSSQETKELCARTILNLLTPENFSKCCKGGAQRAFASICADVDSASCQAICGTGLLIFTSMTEGSEDLAHRSMVMSEMFRIINAESFFTKYAVAKATCNLLTQKHSRIQALQAGGFAILKIIATLNRNRMYEMVAQTLLVLICDVSVHGYLMKEPVASMLAIIVKEGHGNAFDTVIVAAAVASQYEMFKIQLIEKGIIASLIVSILKSQKIDKENFTELVATMVCNLSTVPSHVEWLVVEASILVILHALWKFCPNSAKSGTLIALCIRNLSSNYRICKIMAEQKAFVLTGQILEAYSSESEALCRLAIYTIQNFARKAELHEQLLNENTIEILQLVVFRSPEGIETLTPNPMLTGIDVFNTVRCIDLIAVSPQCREEIVRRGTVQLLNGLRDRVDDNCRFAMANSLCSLSASPECRGPMVDQNASNLIVALSETEDDTTQLKCAEALSFLSETTVTDPGMAKAMLSMTENSLIEKKRLSTEQNKSPHHSTGFLKVKHAIRTHLEDPELHRLNMSEHTVIETWQNKDNPADPLHAHLLGGDEEHDHPNTLAKYSVGQVENEKELYEIKNFEPYFYKIQGYESTTGLGGMANNQDEIGRICWPQRPQKYIELQVILPSVNIKGNTDVPSRHDEMGRVDIDFSGLDKDRTQQDTISIEDFYKTMQMEMNPTSRANSSGAAGASPIINNRKTMGDTTPHTRKVNIDGPASVDRSVINKRKSRKKSTNASSSMNELKQSESAPNSPAPALASSVS